MIIQLSNLEICDRVSQKNLTHQPKELDNHKRDINECKPSGFFLIILQHCRLASGYNRNQLFISDVGYEIKNQAVPKRMTFVPK